MFLGKVQATLPRNHIKYVGLVTVHAYVPSNGICRGFAFKYGKFLLPPRFLTALSVPKVPTREPEFPLPTYPHTLPARGFQTGFPPGSHIFPYFRH